VIERVEEHEHHVTGNYLAPVWHLLMTRDLGEMVIVITFGMSRIYVYVSYLILIQHCWRHWQGPWNAPLPGNDLQYRSIAETVWEGREGKTVKGRRLYKILPDQPLLICVKYPHEGTITLVSERNRREEEAKKKLWQRDYVAPSAAPAAAPAAAPEAALASAPASDSARGSGLVSAAASTQETELAVLLASQPSSQMASQPASQPSSHPSSQASSRQSSRRASRKPRGVERLVDRVTDRVSDASARRSRDEDSWRTRAMSQALSYKFSRRRQKQMMRPSRDEIEAKIEERHLRSKEWQVLNKRNENGQEHKERVEVRKRLQWFHLLIGVQLVVCFLYFLARLTASLSQNTIQPLGISLCPSTEDCTQWQVVLARFVYDSTVRCTPLVLGGLFIFECSLLNYDAEQLARYIDVCEVRNDETILALIALHSAYRDRVDDVSNRWKRALVSNLVLYILYIGVTTALLLVLIASPVRTSTGYLYWAVLSWLMGTIYFGMFPWAGAQVFSSSVYVKQAYVRLLQHRGERNHTRTAGIAEGAVVDHATWAKLEHFVLSTTQDSVQLEVRIPGQRGGAGGFYYCGIPLNYRLRWAFVVLQGFVFVLSHMRG